MKKKATARPAKATSRQSTLNFPTSSEADLVAESTAAETSTKSGAKSRRKRTADCADDADKHNETNGDSSVPVSSAPTERNKIAQGKKRSAAALGQHLSTTESPEGATEPSSSAKNRRRRTADFADDTDKHNESHCDSSAVSAQSAVKTHTPPTTENVPKNWRLTTISEIAESLDNRRVPVNKAERAKRHGPIPYYGANGQVGWIDNHIFDEPLVLVVEDETFTGRTLPFSYVIRGKTWVNNHAHVLRAKELVTTEFLNYSLSFYPFTPLTTGSTGRRKLTKNALMSAPYLLPPLPEQHRIVAEIEKQFTRLDAGVAALTRVQANLKRYRAAVLKAACEGKLVPTEAELRRTAVKTPPFETGAQLLQRILTERRQNWQGRGLYKEPEAPQTSILPPLPEGWTWTRLEQLGVTYGGLTKNPKRAKLTKQLPYLRVANVYANELRLDDIEYIGVADSELNKLLVQVGDLLIVEGNGSKDQIGRLAIWNGSIESCVHQNHLIKVRPVDPQMPKWILHWLQSPGGRQFVEIVASSTSGLFTLSVNKVGNLMIPLPPLAEQTRIVAEVERRLSVVDELEAVASANLQRAARLWQSILQKAFTGGL